MGKYNRFSFSSKLCLTIETKIINVVLNVHGEYIYINYIIHREDKGMSREVKFLNFT